MTWRDRLREAAYSSPSGFRQVFAYENVAKTVEKKTAAFDFPDAEGTYIQDLGPTGRRYPLRVFFWGDDHDIEASTFENALLETGAGRLEHPLYGAVDVVPFGEIKTRDDLKTAANQTIIEVTFWATIGLIYPQSQTEPAAVVAAAVVEFNASVAQEFGTATATEPAGVRVTSKSNYESALDTAEATLQNIADTQADVAKQFDAIKDSINRSIDVLVGTPLTLAFQTVLLIQTPARIIDNATARLSAYGDLTNSIVGNLADSVLGPITEPLFGDGSEGSGGRTAPVEYGVDARAANAYYLESLYASAYISGLVLSVINAQFATKTDALKAAEFLLQQLERLVAWQDENLTSLAATDSAPVRASTIDTGAAYQQLQEAVALAAGFLVQISFSLKQERRVVLTRNRTIIDLTAELYGSVDDQLDFLINTNGLTGSEILELPKGREIVYYV